eukprot:Selendium_serpulae@DN7568_c0_g1_i1.p1
MGVGKLVTVIGAVLLQARTGLGLALGAQKLPTQQQSLQGMVRNLGRVLRSRKGAISVELKTFEQLLKAQEAQLPPQLKNKYRNLGQILRGHKTQVNSTWRKQIEPAKEEVISVKIELN